MRLRPAADRRPRFGRGMDVRGGERAMNGPYGSQDKLVPGLHYVSRDGSTTTHLDAFLAHRPGSNALRRPERDVLRALLVFCLDGLALLDVQDSSLMPLPTSAPQE